MSLKSSSLKLKVTHLIKKSPTFYGTRGLPPYRGEEVYAPQWLGDLCWRNLKVLVGPPMTDRYRPEEAQSLILQVGGLGVGITSKVRWEVFNSELRYNSGSYKVTTITILMESAHCNFYCTFHINSECSGLNQMNVIHKQILQKYFKKMKKTLTNKIKFYKLNFRIFNFYGFAFKINTLQFRSIRAEETNIGFVWVHTNSASHSPQKVRSMCLQMLHY
jgi:hypothetical protein